MNPLWRVASMGRREWLPLVAGLIMAWLAAFAGVALMAGSGAYAGLLATGAVLAGAPWILRVLGVARFVLRYAERLATHGATFRTLARLRVWLFHALAERSAGGLGVRRSGDALARLVGDVEALDGLYIRILLPALVAMALFPILIALLWRADAYLAVGCGILFLAAAFGLPWLAARSSLALGIRLAAAQADLRIAVVDAVSALREIRAFGAEGRVLATVQARESSLLRAQREASVRAAWAQAGALLCAQAALLLALASTSGPAAFAAVFLVIAVFEVAGGLPRAGALAGHAAAAAGRLLAITDSPVPVPDPAAPASLPQGTALRFEAVRFAWPDRPPLLDALTLDVPAGARVAILGPSGSGKSTLASLLLKVVAPQSGRITMGRTDIARLRAEDVRARVAYLSQATHLFADTVRANLLLGRPGATDADLWEALDAAAVAEMVRALPEGLGTWLGEGGAGLSGGQARRIALARTLLSTAPILLLDEPASGLDPEVERAFLTTLNQVGAGRTVILIAHRLTGVERLDRIWRLSAGHAVAAAG